MGRPKGSKNKVKLEIKDSGLVATLPGDPIKPKPRKRKALELSTLDKLKAAGISIDELRALLAVPATAPVSEDKAALKHAMMNAPIGAAELASLRKEAAKNMALVKDPQLVVQEAVNQVIVPNWDKTPQDGAGLRHFIVKAIRNGDAVSFDKERWDAALKAANVRGIFHTCKPEGSADVEPQAGQAGGRMSLWRVMIG